MGKGFCCKCKIADVNSTNQRVSVHLTVPPPLVCVFFFPLSEPRWTDWSGSCPSSEPSGCRPPRADWGVSELWIASLWNNSSGNQSSPSSSSSSSTSSSTRPRHLAALLKGFSAGSDQKPRQKLRQIALESFSTWVVPELELGRSRDYYYFILFFVLFPADFWGETEDQWKRSSSR